MLRKRVKEQDKEIRRLKKENEFFIMKKNRCLDTDSDPIGFKKRRSVSI